jgi:betaine-homocysteine S-methyltransferase
MKLCDGGAVNNHATTNSSSAAATSDLATRLAQGPVICAEGYLFELERRGYLQAGSFVPEVVLEHPEEVTTLHRAFVHAGSDVVQAFTYYAHREKLRIIGKESLLEPLNRQALVLAKQVAGDTGSLFAGDICNTNIYDPHEPNTAAQVRAMFVEQVGWAVEAGVNFIVGETFDYVEEALIALDVIRQHGLPAVITLAIHRLAETRDGYSPAEACRRLADAGADVVGLNCIRGPMTMLPLLPEIIRAVDVPVAALPVTYRTDTRRPTMQSLSDPAMPSEMPFPTALEAFSCNRYEIAEFTRQATDFGVQYFGLCCGAAPHHVRSMAQTLGRTPPASRYSADMSKHVFLGTDSSLRPHNIAFQTQL